MNCFLHLQRPEPRRLRLRRLPPPQGARADARVRAGLQRLPRRLVERGPESAAAGAGTAGARDQAHRAAGWMMIWLAGRSHLPLVDGGDCYGGCSADEERRLSRRFGRA